MRQLRASHNEYRHAIAELKERNEHLQQLRQSGELERRMAAFDEKLSAEVQALRAALETVDRRHKDIVNSTILPSGQKAKLLSELAEEFERLRYWSASIRQRTTPENIAAELRSP